MALHALVTCKKKLWRNVNGIKCHNPHSFQEGVIFYVRISLKQDEYHIYIAQLSLPFLTKYGSTPG